MTAFVSYDLASFTLRLFSDPRILLFVFCNRARAVFEFDFGKPRLASPTESANLTANRASTGCSVAPVSISKRLDHRGMIIIGKNPFS